MLIVTGRSAGWVSGLSSLMPVAGADRRKWWFVLSIWESKPVVLTPISDLAKHRQHLATTFENLQTKFPQIQESADNRFRVTDWTFDVAGLSQMNYKP